MTGLLPGVVVGDRYTLVRLLSEQGDAQAWAARDDRLDRSVTLVVLPTDSPLAAGVFDAAQRAAGVDNHRLVRILDIADVDGWVYFVEESLDGARSMTELAGRSGMAAEEVRRLTGEAALGLDSARRRGLHHLGLTPDNVLRMPDGSVKVAGLATQAALAGQDHIGGERALRRDAKGLVALAYAGLTGRWPYAGDVGLEPAPRVVGGVPRPSELAVGVPSDLDTLCQQTLSLGQGPISPADYAAQIAPWSAMTVADRAVLDATPDAAEQAREADAAAAELTAQLLDEAEPEQSIETTVPRPSAGSGAATAPIPLAPTATGSPATAFGEASARAGHTTGWLTPRPGAAGVAGGAAAGVAGAAGATATTAAGATAAAGGPATDAGAAGAGAAGAGAAGAGAAGAGAVGAGAAGLSAAMAKGLGAVTAGARRLTGRISRPAAGTASGADQSVPAASEARSEPVAAARSRAHQSAPTAPEARSEPVQTTRSRAARNSGTGRRRPAEAAPGTTPDVRTVAIHQAPAAPELEAPAPLLPPEAGAPPTKAQSRLVLALFAGLTALAGILGAAGASQIGKGMDINAILGPDSTHVSSPRPSVSSASQTPSGTGEALPIMGASGYDPEGDNIENNDLAARVFDEDPKTYWQSEGYQGPKFGGLKSGVGLVIDLGQEVTPSAVTLTLPNPSTLEVYLGNDPDKSSATLFGKISGRSGQVVLNSTSPVKGSYLIVWFTDAPLVADGRYRATLAEITVTG